MIGAQIVIWRAICRYSIFSGFGWSFYDGNSSKILRKRKLTKNIYEAKERGVFIKDLKYKADSSIAKLEFHLA